MNVIIGISHPKHVYIFKNTIQELKSKNHKVLVLVSDKEITVALLERFGLDYILLGSNNKGLINKIFQSLVFTWKTIKLSISFKPDIYFGVGFIHFALSSALLRKKFIFIEDTEVAEKLQKLLMPFTDSFLTTKAYKKKISPNQIWFNGNLELAYLHPKRQLSRIINTVTEKYVLIRFVSWEAFHDIGHQGLSIEAKRKLVREISKSHNVFIASEGELPSEFEQYRLNIPIEKIHEFVSGADLVIGESPTMTTEAAMLGTPAICISSWACDALGNFEELYKADLIYCYHPEKEEDAITKAIGLLKIPDLKKIWKKKSEVFINSRIDVTSFMVWFIENYPKSHQIMKDNPDYQNRFK